MVLAVLFVLGSGNIVLWGVCYYVWKKVRAVPAAAGPAIA
jgi:hypothetical protein